MSPFRVAARRPVERPGEALIRIAAQREAESAILAGRALPSLIRSTFGRYAGAARRSRIKEPSQ